jgi:hypothetical protein
MIENKNKKKTLKGHEISSDMLGTWCCASKAIHFLHNSQIRPIS